MLALLLQGTTPTLPLPTGYGEAALIAAIVALFGLVVRITFYMLSKADSREERMFSKAEKDTQAIGELTTVVREQTHSIGTGFDGVHRRLDDLSRTNSRGD